VNSLDLIVDTQLVTPAAIEALLASREEDDLICDRCLDPDEPLAATMMVEAIGLTFALCGACARELPKGYQEV
jgi:hypothetical protein